ncbi:hypothetical protein D3C72_1487990 [compost metagenome]
MGRRVHRRTATIEERTGERGIARPDCLGRRLFVVDHRQGRAIAALRIVTDKHAAGTVSGGDESRKRVTLAELSEACKDPLPDRAEIVMAPGRPGQHRIGDAERLAHDTIRRNGIELDVGLADIEHRDRALIVA